MTREEAAKVLEKQFDESCVDYRYQNKDKLDYEDALWLAIAALREQMDWISVKDRKEEKRGRIYMAVRTIIFRGKRLDNGEWVYGFIVKMFGTYHIIDKDDENTAYEVIPETIGQYTGLKDKNGKRIFEGDILGSRYNYLSPDNVAVEVVKWFCNSWVIQEGDRMPTMLEEDEIMPYSEVVGNVHDNKELWGGTDNS